LIRAILAVSAVLLLAGCKMGPNYSRPAVPVPDQFHGTAAATAANSLADTKWFDLFQDDVLKQLVSTALEHNFDLGIASERVLEARAQYRITRANQFPSLSAQPSFTSERQSSVGSFLFIAPGTNLAASYTQVGAALSWELDFWGRYRRLTEAARAQYLATEEARNGVVVSLVSDVMNDYFMLRERDLELEIDRRTRDIAQDNLRLVNLRHDRGAATGLDVHQAEQFLYTATSQIAVAERDIEQTEDALSLLLGRVPGSVARGKSLDQFTPPAEVPAGLPSALLERRPDVRQAEATLIAANAQIGAAKALYFPQISLTGFLGAQSRQLTNMFTAPARFDSIAAGATQTIFDAGQTRAGVRLSEAQKREMVITYQKTIYNALKEVSDSLVGYDRTRQQRAQEQLLVRALSESDRLSNLRYRGGLDSYLQVLDSERDLFQGQLVLAQLQMIEMQSLVQIYRALGGGWQ